MTKLESQDFHQDATITFVPTAAGASGIQQIAQFLHMHKLSLATFFPSSFGSTSGEEVTVKQRFASEEFEMEEMMVRFTFDRAIDWLMPGVKPNMTEITLPLVYFLPYLF